MLLAIVILGVAAAVATVVAFTQYRRAQELRKWLLQAAPYVKRSGAPFAEIEPILFFSDWEVIEEGGDNVPGEIGNLDDCPCQKEYTVNTVQTSTGNNPPTKKQKEDCLKNPPPTDPPEWKCPDDCVQIMTHRWTGYTVVKNKKTGEHRLNCNRFAQYHCKKPDDPAKDDPPVEGPPPPTT